MNLSEELIKVLEQARLTGEYHSPIITDGVLNAILEGDPHSEELISDELAKWSSSLWSR